MSSFAAKKRKVLAVRQRTKKRHAKLGLGVEGSASRLRREALYSHEQDRSKRRRIITDNDISLSLTQTHKFLLFSKPEQRRSIFLSFSNKVRSEKTRCKPKMLIFVSSHSTAIRLAKELGVKRTVKAKGRFNVKTTQEIKGVRTFTMLTKEHDAKGYCEDWVRGKVHTVVVTEDSPDLDKLIKQPCDILINYDLPETVEAYRLRQGFCNGEIINLVSDAKASTKKKGAIMEYLKREKIEPVIERKNDAEKKVEVSDVPKVEAIKREITAIYERWNPSKLEKPGFIDTLLKKTKGKEEALLQKLRHKYK
eukprot:g4963.t1